MKGGRGWKNILLPLRAILCILEISVRSARTLPLSRRVRFPRPWVAYTNVVSRPP